MPLTLITRGSKSGRCNICGEVGPLTEDHTPPKGCVRPTAMMLEHAIDRLDMRKGIKSKANDGVKYRTLCSRCNNAVLGGRYDPALIDFVNRVSAVLESRILLPSTVPIPAKPHLIARAVWGHMAAVGVDRYPKGPDTEMLSEFFLDESLSLPPQLNFYYWLYPYRRQALIKDAGVLDMRGGSAVFWMMKFYPLAFAIWRTDNGYRSNYRDLAQYRSGRPNDLQDVLLDLHSIPHELILEAPTDTQAIMYGQEAIVANGRPPLGRVLRV